MNKTEQAKVSIRNTLDIINNSILILKDFDSLLEEEGFVSTDPTRIQCEPSKSMNQHANSSRRFFPLFMSRYYCLDNEEDTRSMLGINIQYYHRNEQIEITPSISAFLVTWEEPQKKPLRTESWWLKYVIYECSERLASENFQSEDYILDGRTYQFTPKKENKHFTDMSFTFWGHELMDIGNSGQIKEKLVTRLIEQHKKFEEGTR